MNHPPLLGQITFGGVKEALAAINSLLTICALMSAGWWFYKQNQDAPRLKIEHFVSAHPDSESSRKLLISVEVRATNTGNVPILAPGGTVRLVKIAPNPLILNDSHMVERVLQPGESDQLYFHIYRFDNHPETIQVETHVPGAGGSEWETNSLFDVRPNNTAYSVSESGRRRD